MTTKEMIKLLNFARDTTHDDERAEAIDAVIVALRQFSSACGGEQPLVAATFPVELPTGAAVDGGIVHIGIPGSLLQGRKEIRAIILGIGGQP